MKEELGMVLAWNEAKSKLTFDSAKVHLFRVSDSVLSLFLVNLILSFN